MTRFKKLIVGYPEDPALLQAWWHRLAIVLIRLGGIAVTIWVLQSGDASRSVAEKLGVMTVAGLSGWLTSTAMWAGYCRGVLTVVLDRKPAAVGAGFRLTRRIPLKTRARS